MNRMNVNFFICENSIIFFFILFCLGALFCLVFSVCLVRKRWLPWGVQGSPLCEWLGGQCPARALSLTVCVSHALFFFFPFKIGILHVEPAIEDSEN